MTRSVCGLALLCALTAAACGSDSSTPTTPAAVTSPTTVTWSTQLTPGGTASRTFTASQAGTVTATLQAADAALGLGIGVPRGDGGGCRLATSQLVAIGGSVSATVDTGDYCVLLYDQNNAVTSGNFTLQIVYP